MGFKKIGGPQCYSPTPVLNFMLIKKFRIRKWEKKEGNKVPAPAVKLSPLGNLHVV